MLFQQHFLQYRHKGILFSYFFNLMCVVCHYSYAFWPPCYISFRAWRLSSRLALFSKMLRTISVFFLLHYVRDVKQDISTVNWNSTQQYQPSPLLLPLSISTSVSLPQPPAPPLPGFRINVRIMKQY